MTGIFGPSLGSGGSGSGAKAAYVPDATTGSAAEINAIRDAMIASGAMAPPALPTTPLASGLIADWRFSEGSGTTVADQTGTYGIDLTAAATPNTAWAAHGVTLSGGAVQTPSITGARTIVTLYRAPTDENNYFLQAGPVADNQGPYGRSVMGTENNWLGQGYGVAPVHARSDGQYAWTMITGGWRLYVRELAANTNGIVTFGSRGSATTNRCSKLDLAWAAVYDRPLSDAERTDLFNFARGLSASRGFYIATADCPTQADHIILMGQSNADGRALLTDLAAGDQSRTYARTKIAKGGIDAGPKSYATMALGSNHSDNATMFGLEVPLANMREDTAGAAPLYIRKAARGGTYLAPSSDTNVAAGATWSTQETVSGSATLWLAVAGHYYAMANALEAGVGLNLKGVIWFQGEQDALQASTADVWGAGMTNLIAAHDAHLATPNVPWLIARIYESPPDNAAAYATVRTAQAAAASALGARGVLIDTDAMAHGDYVHLNAAGMQNLATQVAAHLWP